MPARVYATVGNYRAQTGDAITPDARVTFMLGRASQCIDRALIGAIYPVDSNSMPTDTTDIDTFMRATCAQAAFMVDLSDDNGAAARMESTSIGGITVRRGAGTVALALPPLGPTALQILHIEGAVPVAPMSNW